MNNIESEQKMQLRILLSLANTWKEEEGAPSSAVYRRHMPLEKGTGTRKTNDGKFISKGGALVILMEHSNPGNVREGLLLFVIGKCLPQRRVIWREFDAMREIKKIHLSTAGKGI